MGLRVNKRIKIAKGMTLNVGKRGMSVSAKVGNTTINSKGRVTTRISPGVRYTTNLKSKNSSMKNSANETITHNNISNTNTERIIQKPRSKKVSILLCCLGFLGLGGLHKFYEKKWLLGILYLLTFGLFGIGTIKDLLTYFEVKQKYGKTAVTLIWVLFVCVTISLWLLGRKYGYVCGYKIHTAPVMNGLKTERIGTYAYINAKKSDITGGDLVIIYNKIKDSNYNWFTVYFEDGTGVIYRGCSDPEYGIMDEEYGVLNPILIPPLFDDNGDLCGYYYKEGMYD